MTRLIQATFPFHIVWVKLQLNHLPVKLVHVVKYNREDPSVLQLYDIITVEPTRCGTKVMRLIFF